MEHKQIARLNSIFVIHLDAHFVDFDLHVLYELLVVSLHILCNSCSHNSSSYHCCSSICLFCSFYTFYTSFLCSSSWWHCCSSNLWWLEGVGYPCSGWGVGGVSQCWWSTCSGCVLVVTCPFCIALLSLVTSFSYSDFSVCSFPVIHISFYLIHFWSTLLYIIPEHENW